MRKQLGFLCNQQFVFSIWDGPRLRIVPEAFWTVYLNALRAGINNSSVAKKLVSRLRQVCKGGSLDDHNRWDVPESLANHAGLGGKQNGVVLLPDRFWLEVWSAKGWDAFMMETLKCAREANIIPADFEI